MKYLVLLICLVVLAGCEPKPEKDPVALQINNIKIGIKEFNEAYNSSLFTTADGPQTKEEFVETLIKRRLLLSEASKYGLDKDERFLKSVEMFWQQSLLKLIIDRQLRELSVTVDMDEEEVKEYYDKHKESFGDATFEQKKDRVRYMLMRQRQQLALEVWMKDLRKKAKIKIHKKRLEIK